MQKILIVLFLMLTIVSCDNKDGGNSDEADFCSMEFEKIEYIFNDCQLDNDLGNYVSICRMYSKVVSDTDFTCLDKLETFKTSCEEAAKIKTLDDFKAIEGCLNFPLKTKKEICAENQENYCRNVYYSCGEEKIPVACAGYETYGSSESHEIKFDKSKLAEYCVTTENGTQEISGIEDIYSIACGNVEYDCANLTDLNFKNDSWKTSCIE